MITSYKNPLYLEHLEKGVKPIIACIGTFCDFEMSDSYVPKILLSDNKTFCKPYSDNQVQVDDVDYFAKAEDKKNIGSKNYGDRTYVISSISACDKMTRYLYDCTSLLVVGREKRTNREVSFLSHQDPYHFLQKGKARRQFIVDLLESLRDMKTICQDGTIDIIIAGGNYFLDDPDVPYEWKDNSESRESYRNSISLLSKIVFKIFDFEPLVIVGPKTTPRSDALLFINKSRRLYIARPKVGNTTTESFIPKEIFFQEEKW